MTSHRRTEAAYWLLVVVLFVAQAAYTSSGLERLWYEELAEGIRNPFWLEHRLVYDGISGNVGWYALVLVVYKVLGFSPYAAKFVRLSLHLPCLVCSALLLKRWMGIERAWLPLVAIGLSPTQLYFNNLGTSYGTDAELFPVVLFVIASIAARGESLAAFDGRCILADCVAPRSNIPDILGRRALSARRLARLGATPDFHHGLPGGRSGSGRAAHAVLSLSVGSLAMFACLSYPSFLFYLPPLLLFHLWANRAALTAARKIEGLVWMAVGFVAPFATAFAYLRNHNVWIFDPAAGGSGVFRGGGSQLTADPHVIFGTVSTVLNDLFFRGSTYYFAIPHAEFSGVLGVAAAVGILFGSVILAWKWEPVRVPLMLSGLLALSALAAVAFTSNLPGLRRATGFVSGVYVAVACVWAVRALPGRLNRIVISTTRLACLMLVVHHVAVFGANYRYLADETRHVNDEWFYRFGTPSQSVRTWARDWVLQGMPLTCQVPSACRYSEIYPAVAGYLEWNGLGERPVHATDPASGRLIELMPSLWDTHTLQH